MKTLNSLLKEKGKTKAQAAREMNLSRQWFTKVCNGKEVPGKKAAKIISEYFGKQISPAELMRLE